MPAAWITAGSAVLGALGSGSSSGGSQTVSKDPWAPAAPWLTSLLSQGQSLQGYYQANPFNAIQQTSYGNLMRGNDYLNSALPGLLSQLSQSQGFDRSNPRAKPQAIAFPSATGMGYQPVSGLLGVGNGSMNSAANPYANGLMATAPAAAPTALAPNASYDYGSRSPFEY